MGAAARKVRESVEDALMRHGFILSEGNGSVDDAHDMESQESFYIRGGSVEEIIDDGNDRHPVEWSDVAQCHIDDTDTHGPITTVADIVRHMDLNDGRFPIRPESKNDDTEDDSPVPPDSSRCIHCGALKQNHGKMFGNCFVRGRIAKTTYEPIEAQPDSEDTDMEGTETTTARVAAAPIPGKTKTRKRTLKKLEKRAAAKSAPKAKKARVAKAPKGDNVCTCGCKGKTGGFFVPGHDARFKGQLLKVERGQLKPEDLKVGGDYKPSWVKSGKGYVPKIDWAGRPYKAVDA